MSDTAIPVPDLGTPEPSAQLPPVQEPIQPDAVHDGLPPRSRQRSRGRRAAPPPPPPPEAAPISPEELGAVKQALGFGFEVACKIIASKRGEHWQLSAEDRDMLGETWGNALAPWLRESAKYMPLAIAAMATVGVVLPRIQQDAALAEALAPNVSVDGRPSTSPVVNANLRIDK